MKRKSKYSKVISGDKFQLVHTYVSYKRAKDESSSTSALHDIEDAYIIEDEMQDTRNDRRQSEFADQLKSYGVNDYFFKSKNTSNTSDNSASALPPKEKLPIDIKRESTYQTSPIRNYGQMRGEWLDINF